VYKLNAGADRPDRLLVGTMIEQVAAL